MQIQARKLRSILTNALKQIEGVGDDTEIRARPNTFGMEGNILETRDGFISLDDITIIKE